MAELEDALRSRLPLPWAGIVDMHTHMGRTAAFPIFAGDADALVRQMDRVGVSAMCCTHQAVLSAEVVFGNDEMLLAMRRHPGRIHGYAAVFPRDESTGIDEARRCLDAGMIGIKMHEINGIPYDSPAYESIWELADARELPVLLHTWGDMDRYESIFGDYPSARIILAHSGCLRPELYVRIASENPNVWLETAFSAAPCGLVEYLVREVGAERILFGSDMPWMSEGQQIGRIVFADIPEETKHTILVDNPARVLARGEPKTG